MRHSGQYRPDRSAQSAWAGRVQDERGPSLLGRLLGEILELLNADWDHEGLLSSNHVKVALDGLGLEEVRNHSFVVHVRLAQRLDVICGSEVEGEEVLCLCADFLGDRRRSLGDGRDTATKLATLVRASTEGVPLYFH